MDGVIAYALSRAFTKKTVIGMGAIAGKNCQISSFAPITDGNRVTFAWYDNDNVLKTGYIDVMNGQDGQDGNDGQDGQDGISVTNIQINTNYHLICTLSNGTTIDAGQINIDVDDELSDISENPVQNKVIKEALDNKVDKETGKGLSTNDFTTNEKNKLANIEDNAEVNKIATITVNGQQVAIVDKNVALTIITNAVNNLQNYYLKSETYTQQEVQDLIGSAVGVSISIVEVLPETGQTNIIYFLPTETPNVYSQYIYTANDGWVLIGSTTVDLSNYYTKEQVNALLNTKQNILTIDSFPTSLSNNPVASGGVYTAISQMQAKFQYTTLPTASTDNLGMVFQYIGASGTYTQDMFYRCVYNSTLGQYEWQEVTFHADITVDSALSDTSINPVQNKVVKGAIDKKQDIIQVSTMPIAASDLVGKIYQYTGSTTSSFSNGYFYRCDYISGVYVWTEIEFGAVGNFLEETNALPTASVSNVNKTYLLTANQVGFLRGGIYQCQSDGEPTPTYSWVLISEHIVVDNTPTEDSTNAVSSGGVYSAIQDLNLGTASTKDFTDLVRPNSHDLVESGSVYSAINNALSSIYTPRGDLTCAELTSSLLIEENVGNVYQMSDSGTTTSLFINGAEIPISVNDNVGIIKAGQNTYLFNYMGNAFDLHDYQKKDLTSAIEGATTVEGALGALSTNKASKVSGATNGNFAGLDANGNLTDSGKKASDFGTADEIADIVNYYGSKNLCIYPFNQTTKTTNGITFTDNGDGTVTATGTATDNAIFNVSLRLEDGKLILPNGEYKVNGCPSGGSTNSYWMVMSRTSGGTSENYGNDTGNGMTATLNGDDFSNDNVHFQIAIVIKAGYEITTPLVFKPMVRLATIKDDTFVPYAKTNHELTVDKAEQAEVNDIVNVYGAKNLIPYPYNENSLTSNGITYIDNGDGSVTASGTSTGSARYYLIRAPFNGYSGSLNFTTNPTLEKGKTYTLSCTADKDTTNTKMGIGVYLWNNVTYTNKAFTTLIPGSVTFTLPDDDTYNAYTCYVYTTSGGIVNDVTVKPMIRCGSIKDDTWELYAPTNAELHKNKVSYADNGVLGAKNLLQNTATSQTVNTVAFTVNSDDKTVNVTRTAEQTEIATRDLYVVSDEDYKLLAGKTLLMTGCPSGGSNDTYYLECYYNDGTGHWLRDVGDGLKITLPATKPATIKFLIGIKVASVIPSGGLTFKPMLRLASDPDDTYQPYAMTNKELTDKVIKSGTITSGINTNGYLNETLQQSVNVISVISQNNSQTARFVVSDDGGRYAIQILNGTSNTPITSGTATVIYYYI